MKRCTVCDHIGHEREFVVEEELCLLCEEAVDGDLNSDSEAEIETVKVLDKVEEDFKKNFLIEEKDYLSEEKD